MQRDIPEGYKQTEVGVIPEDWAVSTIGENTRWSSGGTPNRKRDDYWEGSIPWISGSTLKTLEISTSDQFITAEGVTAGSNMAPVNSTLLLVRGSALHKCIRAGLVTSPVSFNQDVKSLMPTGSVHPRFLTFFIKGMESELLKLVSSAGNSAGVLDTLLVKNFKFLKPSFSEQTAIANALSDVDALITSLENLITKKRAIKTAAMQQLLTGKMRLPPFDKTHTGYKQTELGEIPEDWEWKLLPELVISGGNAIKIGPFGSALKKEYLTKDGYKVYGQENVYDKDMVVGDRFIDHEHYSQLVSCSIKPGDFLISMMGTVGKCFIVPKVMQEGIMDSHLLRLRIDRNKLDKKLLIQFFQSPLVLRQIKQLSVGGIMEGLSSKIIKSIAVPVGSIEEQKKIAQALESVDTEVDAIAQRLTKTRQLKQGMMQELLTGKTRLV
ncbi:MAG: restriction endonuclease subunit S [Candidatus Sedimenticola sp. (ex Thyasira tokunagai)]